MFGGVRLSIRLFVRLSVCALLLENHHRVFISRSIQNGGAFKMVVVPTGWAIAVDHAFNYLRKVGALKPCERSQRF